MESARRALAAAGLICVLALVGAVLPASAALAALEEGAPAPPARSIPVAPVDPDSTAGRIVLSIADWLEERLGSGSRTIRLTLDAPMWAEEANGTVTVHLPGARLMEPSAPLVEWALGDLAVAVTPRSETAYDFKAPLPAAIEKGAERLTIGEGTVSGTWRSDLEITTRLEANARTLRLHEGTGSAAGETMTLGIARRRGRADRGRRRPVGRALQPRSLRSPGQGLHPGPPRRCEQLRGLRARSDRADAGGHRRVHGRHGRADGARRRSDAPAGRALGAIRVLGRVAGPDGERRRYGLERRRHAVAGRAGVAGRSGWPKRTSRTSACGSRSRTSCSAPTLSTTSRPHSCPLLPPSTSRSSACRFAGSQRRSPRLPSGTAPVNPRQGRSRTPSSPIWMRRIPH